MKLKNLFQATVAAAAIALAAPASAYYYIDDTTGSPTFDRALEDFSDLSAVGLDVAYDVFGFSVTASGTYQVRSIAEGYFGGDDDTPPWDQFVFLYQTSFDPSQPLVNGVIADDDYDGIVLNGIGASGFDVALTAGTSYFLVTTGFAPDDAGQYLNVIRGPGEIIPVIPEPGTYALLAMGLGAVVLAVRRRRSERD
jgi:hypothetical protein